MSATATLVKYVLARLEPTLVEYLHLTTSHRCSHKYETWVEVTEYNHEVLINNLYRKSFITLATDWILFLILKFSSFDFVSKESFLAQSHLVNPPSPRRAVSSTSG